MDLDALLSKEGAMIAAAVLGVTLSVRATLAKTMTKEVLGRVWVKALSMLLPLLLGPSLGVVLLHSIEAWQERVLTGLVASAFLMLGRDALKLGGKAVGLLE